MNTLAASLHSDIHAAAPADPVDGAPFYAEAVAELLADQDNYAEWLHDALAGHRHVSSDWVARFPAHLQARMAESDIATVHHLMLDAPDAETFMAARAELLRRYCADHSRWLGERAALLQAEEAA